MYRFEKKEKEKNEMIERKEEEITKLKDAVSSIFFYDSDCH